MRRFRFLPLCLSSFGLTVALLLPGAIGVAGPAALLSGVA